MLKTLLPTSDSSGGNRRGVVLIIALGLLALFAAVGLSFAVVSKYESFSARNFKRYFQADDAGGEIDVPIRPLAEFAVSQLVHDTRQTNSALRGHSLLRDMYGSPVDESTGGLGADPEARNQAANEAYKGAYNGNGIFAPLDDPGNSNLFTDATLGLSSNPTLKGAIEDSEAAYFLARQRPVIGLDSAGNPRVVAGTAGTIPQLFPILPHSFMWFDQLGGGGGGGRPQTNDRRQPERFTTDPTGTSVFGFFGFDEDYDYPDYNNWFLAMERADGQPVAVSFHRPFLVRHFESLTPAFFANAYASLDPNVGSPDPNFKRRPAWRDNNADGRGRGLILRPRELEYNASVVFNDPKRGNRWKDLVDLDGSGVVGDTPEELDVDTDGDGIKDAIWIDLGYPVQTLGEKKYKPLFAFKVLSLDGKINLNIHGNFTDENSTLASTTPNGLGELHNSNLGASVTEINPKHAYLLHDQRVNATSELTLPEWQRTNPTVPLNPPPPLGNLGPTQYRALLGTLDGQTDPGRYTREGQPPLATDRPGVSFIVYPTTGDDNAALYPATTDYPGLEFAGKPDWHGFGRYYEPFNQDWRLLTGAPGFQPAFVRNVFGNYLNYPGVPGNNRKADRNYDGGQINPTEVVKDDAIETNVYTPNGTDWLFTPSDQERLLRSKDIDTSILAPRLAQVLENCFGTPTTPTTVPLVSQVREDYARQRMRRMFTYANWDLNRFSFPPSFTKVNDPVFSTLYNEDLGATDLKHRGQFPVTGNNANLSQWILNGLHTRLNLNGPDRQGDPDPLRPYVLGDPTIDQDRTRLAGKIFVLLYLAVRPDALNPAVQGQIRTLAQLAVNIVDYMDPDDVMTALPYADDLSTFVSNFDPTNFSQPDHIVFGFEMPRVVVNEAMVLSYRHDDGSGTPVNNDTVWVFAELHAPWSGTDYGPVDLVNPLLNQATGFDHSTYQLRVIDTKGNRTQVVDFQYRTTDVAQMPTTPLPTDPDWAKILPGGFFLVGPPSPTETERNPAMGGTKKAPPTGVLFNGYVPTSGMGGPGQGGKLNSFTSDQLKYERGSHQTANPYQIGIYRLRNPFQQHNASSNPYVQLDQMQVISSPTYGPTATGGAWEISDGMMMTENPPVGERISRQRLRAWHGEARSALTVGDFAYANDFQMALYLGAPDYRVGGVTGFVKGTVSPGTPHTLLDTTSGSSLRPLADNTGAASAAGYFFPFLNRKLATPLELLSVRLYGSHRWKDNTPVSSSVVTGVYGPTGAPATLPATVLTPEEWRLRFTDDYARLDSTVLELPPSEQEKRIVRDRVVPWLEDNRDRHPYDRTTWNPPPAPVNAPMLPDLYRFFEFVECRSRMAGAEIQDPSSLYPRQVRVPGKICLNTITDEEIFRALFDDPWVMPAQRVENNGVPLAANRRLPPNYFDPSNPNVRFPFNPRHNLHFGQLFDSRRGTGASLFPFGRDVTVTALETVSPPIRPTLLRFGDPFATRTTAALYADLTTSADTQVHRAVTRQWPGIDRDSSASQILPGRDPTEQVHSEVYRMFLLSRAGRDGITGTADDKPFRSFAAPRLSDTILRQRNFARLDGIEGEFAQTGAALNQKTGEYLVNLVDNNPATTPGTPGQPAPSPTWVPRLFDPIASPLPVGTVAAISGPVSEASFGTDTISNYNNPPDIGPLNIPAVYPPASRDTWMLEHERNRLLAKISGNVTTRSHVFACWLTIGFFAVEPGTEGAQVPCLNEEIGIDDGENHRHRVFFIVDRSKATKYDGPPAVGSSVSLQTMGTQGILPLPNQISVIE